MTPKKALAILTGILALRLIGLLWLVFYSGIGLGPDECQYWTWSRDLALGYYSKPPGIAWQIWLGCKLFGYTELGVRAGSLLLGSGMAYGLYTMALAAGLQPRGALWAGIIMALSPLGIMASFLAITDVGMVFFWILALIPFLRALHNNQPPNFLQIGIWILCSALFKWPAYILWALIIPFTMIYFPRSLRALFGGVIVSLIGLLPSLWWNWGHDWATFRHVGTTMVGGHQRTLGTTPLFHGNFWDFLGAQAVLLSPILFIALLWAIFRTARRFRTLSPAIRFCWVLTVLPLILYCILALFQKMQGNWCDYIYPTAIVLLVFALSETAGHGRRTLCYGTALSVLLCSFAFVIPYIQAHTIWPRIAIPYAWNPFKHNVGWNNISDVLNDAGYDAQENFLFSDRYQMSSVLSFYGPGQPHAYFFNLQGARKNQFSYWPGMPEEQLGKTGYFAFAENSPKLFRESETWIKMYREMLGYYFDKVEFLGIQTLFSSYQQPVKGLFLFRCAGYNGKVPEESSKY